MTKGDMLPVSDSVRTVTAVDGPDGQGGDMGAGSGSLTDIVLTLDSAIPSAVAVNSHVVENITYTPEVNIHDNVFKETPTRGILVTTRKKVTIENNLFDGMGMAGIYISNDAQTGTNPADPRRDDPRQHVPPQRIRRDPGGADEPDRVHHRHRAQEHDDRRQHLLRQRQPGAQREERQRPDLPRQQDLP